VSPAVRLGKTLTVDGGGVMALLGRLIKGGLAAKAVQVAQRELRKPANRKRINDAMAKVKNRKGTTGNRQGPAT
jgi:hypothetical protein